MLPWPFGITVTVQRGTPGRFNDMTYTDHHTLEGCIEYPAASTEGAGNAQVTNVRELLCAYGSDVLATDRIKYPDGLIFQVQGLPKHWKHPITGWEAGTQVSLERVT